MQKTLDYYGSGIQIAQVQMQKVDPPAQVIDAFRDVQAAQADLQRLQNEAQTYANRVVPDARGRAAQIIQVAEGLQGAGGRRSDRPERTLPESVRRIQESARRHTSTHLSRNHGAHSRRRRETGV